MLIPYVITITIFLFLLRSGIYLLFIYSNGNGRFSIARFNMLLLIYRLSLLFGRSNILPSVPQSFFLPFYDFVPRGGDIRN